MRFHHVTYAFKANEKQHAYTLNSDALEGFRINARHYAPCGALLFIEHNEGPTDGSLTVWTINGDTHVGTYLRDSQTITPGNEEHPISDSRSAVFVGTVVGISVDSRCWEGAK